MTPTPDPEDSAGPVVSEPRPGRIIQCPDCHGHRHLPGGPLLRHRFPDGLQQVACPRCSGTGWACGMPHDPELRAQLRAAQEEVAQLRYNADLHLDWYHSVQADLRASEAANAALRGALEPFADADHRAAHPDPVQGCPWCGVVSALSTDAGQAYLDVVEAARAHLIAGCGDLNLQHAFDALARVQEASIGKGDNES